MKFERYLISLPILGLVLVNFFFGFGVQVAQAQTCENQVESLYQACKDDCDSKLAAALTACGNDQVCQDQADSLASSCYSTCDSKRTTALAACASQNTGAGAGAGSLGEQYQDIMSQGLIFAGICESRETPCDCRDEGKCSLENLLQVVVNISVLILGISGTVTLAVLFYGGFLWITAHGNPAMVDSGKKAIIGAAIGLGIIFGAYAAITLLVKILTTGEVTAPGEQLENVIEEAVPGSGGTIETGNQ